MVCNSSSESGGFVGNGDASVHPVVPFSNGGTLCATVPGSKSLSNRALMFAAMISGEVLLDGVLFSDDTLIAIDCLERLGVDVDAVPGSAQCRVRGKGRFDVEEADLFVGNAGTVARFLPAVLAVAGSGRFRIDGTAEMRRRPIAGLMEALRGMGVSVRWLGEDGYFPLEMTTGVIVGNCWEVDAARSSQILSALLMAAPLAGRPILVRLLGQTVSWPFVEMTLAMMREFGAVIEVGEDQREFRVEATGYRWNKSSGYRIEPDATAASYFMALPLAVGGVVKMGGIVRAGLQGDIAFSDVLGSLGYRIEWTGERDLSISWEGPSWRDPVKLSAIRTFDFNAISDTFLTLAAIAPLLPHPVRIEGIGHTRAQESDRIEAIAEGLRRLRQRVVTESSALEIHPDPVGLRAAASEGVSIPTWRDHRVAMSFAILGCADLCETGQSWLRIEDPGCVAKTFPDFFKCLEAQRIGGGQ